jgi:hypothetical protein
MSQNRCPGRARLASRSTMIRNLSFELVAAILACALAAGCDRIGAGHRAPVDDGAPSPEQLQKIGYMSSANTGVRGRKVYDHLEQAKTCGDLELAMRWNRPPNIDSGAFNKKMNYVEASFPAELAKNSEVFLTGRIERGQTMPSGSANWYLRLKDGALVQAIETADFWEKQEQAAQSGGTAAVVEPEKPGRALCIQGVYEGVAGKSPEQPDQKIPLVSVLFAMDRSK